MGTSGWEGRPHAQPGRSQMVNFHEAPECLNPTGGRLSSLHPIYIHGFALIKFTDRIL